MSFLRFATRLLALAVAIALAWVFGPRIAAALKQPPTVTVTTPTQQDAERLLAVTGRVRARLRNDLTPVIRGRIIELTKTEGDTVRCGDVLARFDDSLLEAQLAEAAARREEATDRLVQARRDLERAVELQQSGIAAGGTLEDAQLAVQVASRGVTAAASRVTAIDAQREDLVLRSRLDGVVLERPVDPGQVAGPGEVVYVIATVTNPLIEAEIDERFLDDLAIGQRATVATISNPDAIYDAELTYVGRSIDRLSGAAIVRFRFLEAPDALAIGCTLDVNVRVAAHPQAIVVPRAAIADLEGEPWVLVAEPTENPDGYRLIRRSVDAIDWPGDHIVVRNGLASADAVVLEPQSAPDGPVRVQQATTKQ